MTPKVKSRDGCLSDMMLLKKLFNFFAGGIGEAVLAAVAEESGVTVRILAVREIPRSGPGDALLKMFGISANHIVKAVKSM